MVASAKSLPRRRPVEKTREKHKPKTLLFRLRGTDSSNGVSERTLKKLSQVLDMPETQVIHQALRKLADDFIPAYEADDGPVSNATLKALKARVPQNRYKTPVSMLFPE